MIKSQLPKAIGIFVLWAEKQWFGFGGPAFGGTPFDSISLFIFYCAIDDAIEIPYNLTFFFKVSEDKLLKNTVSYL
jgi:hypothetical protein